MNGIILAAGNSLRFRPLTEETPKPMLKIGGKPLLEHLVKLFVESGVANITINLYHKSAKIITHFGEGTKWGAKINYSYEDVLLGTAGGARKCFLPNENSWEKTSKEPILLSYGDNLTNFNLQLLIDFHKKRKGIATILAYDIPDVSQSGLVKFEKDGLITSFEEKPNNSDRGYVSTGIYILEPEVFSYIPGQKFYDFGRDLFPKILDKRIFAYKLPLDFYFKSCDNIQDYQEMEIDFPSL